MLLAAEDLEARRRDLGGSPDVAALGQRLERLLAPLLNRPLYVPHGKALLSRDGGVCPDDGSRLRFDPLSPERHQCPACDRVQSGERHHRAWIWRYHLWLSERAIHLALLGGMYRTREFLDKAREILEAYATLYPEVPNSDNVLGPTRLFFSTYLESIWLTQLTIAAALIESAGAPRPGSAFDAMVRESSDLIASFDEVWSNRQVWNNAALLGAGAWLSEEALTRQGLDGRHGIRTQLVRGVTADGLWFEGENYHFFALRGFLLAAELARWGGTDLYEPGPTGTALRAMYLAPLDTLLPDLTLPARGDSPYGVSIMQPRFAELWEIGRARASDPRVDGLLADLYGRPASEGPDIGFEELAEQETNCAAHRVARHRLGWKALLWMLPSEPSGPPDGWTAGSRLLSDAGVAVLRTGPGRHVSVECGGHPGGHGHPDLLHVSLHANGPCLADFGTGSYVSPSLHWYRSTLAHNAPGLPNWGQAVRMGRCTAFDEQGAWAWCRAVAERLFGDGTSAVRVILAGPDYVLDVLKVVVPDEMVVELPIHPLVSVAIDDQGDLGPGSSGSGSGLRISRVTLSAGRAGAEVVLAPRDGESLMVQVAPGPPTLAMADGPPLSFLVRSASGAGCWVQVYAFGAGTVADVAMLDCDRVRIGLADGTAHDVRVDEETARVSGPAGTIVELGGRQPPPVTSPHARMTPFDRRSIPCPIVSRVPAPGEWEDVVPADAIRSLGEGHYRRSERPYSEAFSARAAVFSCGTQLCFAASVSKPHVWFRPSDARDPALENEAPDIHSDGIQCYVGTEVWQGFVAVPDTISHQVHVRAVTGPVGDAVGVFGDWCATSEGYAIVIAVDLGRAIRCGDLLSVNLVVNEMYPERERRAGQLVLSGGGGWVYLRGDRESPAAAILAEVR